MIQGILSIQSHVCMGYVGNRAAVFPLQRMGFNVHAVNTVQFSNHTGYGAWKGQVISPQDLAELIAGLEMRGVFSTDTAALLSGYLGSETLGAGVLDAVQKLKAANPKALYVCDPVMGDVGRGVFVRPEIPSFFRNQALKLADIITPNHFELELLCGHKIDSDESLRQGIESLHSLGPSTIVVTSYIANADSDIKPQKLRVIASQKNVEKFQVETPYLDFAIAPNGTGDLFTALFTGHFLKTQNLGKALSSATQAIYKILELNLKNKTRELEIIQGQDFFLASHPSLESRF